KENTRIALARLTEHRTEFDKWWAMRATNERQKWGHPLTLWKHFQRTHIPVTHSGVGHPAEEKKPKSPRPTVEDLTIELNLTKAALAKARDGQLLIDLRRDSTDNIIKTIRNDPACLANPRRFAEVFRRVAFALDQDARARSKAEPCVSARRDKRNGAE